MMVWLANQYLIEKIYHNIKGQNGKLIFYHLAHKYPAHFVVSIPMAVKAVTDPVMWKLRYQP